MGWWLVREACSSGDISDHGQNPSAEQSQPAFTDFSGLADELK